MFNSKNVTNNCFDSVHNTITYRQMKNFDQTMFLQDLAYHYRYLIIAYLFTLENQPWGILDIYDDPNDAMDFFNEIFLSVLDKHAPLKTKHVKHSLQPNWFNSEIAESGKNRDYFHKRQDMTHITDSGEIRPNL